MDVSRDPAADGAEAVSDLVREAQESGRVLGVRMPVDDDESDEPWLLPPSRRLSPRPINGNATKIGERRVVRWHLHRSIEAAARHGCAACTGGGIRESRVPFALKPCGFQRTGSRALSRARNYTHVTLRSRADASTRLSVSCAQTGVGAIFEDQREFGSRLDLRFLRYAPRGAARSIRGSYRARLRRASRADGFWQDRYCGRGHRPSRTQHADLSASTRTSRTMGRTPQDVSLTATPARSERSVEAAASQPDTSTSPWCKASCAKARSRISLAAMAT